MEILGENEFNLPPLEADNADLIASRLVCTNATLDENQIPLPSSLSSFLQKRSSATRFLDLPLILGRRVLMAFLKVCLTPCPRSCPWVSDR